MVKIENKIRQNAGLIAEEMMVGTGDATEEKNEVDKIITDEA